MYKKWFKQSAILGTIFGLILMFDLLTITFVVGKLNGWLEDFGSYCGKIADRCENFRKN
jgi:hypothetical protein